MLRFQQLGLVLVILGLGVVLTIFAGSHTRPSGEVVNNFLNANTLMDVATETSFFAIMAVGATAVIISGGIDLSVGSTYALSAVLMALALRWRHPGGAPGGADTVLLGLAICLGVGLLCGLLNGLMIVGLRVHPFIITLGAMWVYRGIAFVSSRAESILVPESLTQAARNPLGLDPTLRPVPLLLMVLVTLLGWLYLSQTVWGRRVYAVGGNVEASRYAGLRVGYVLLAVYTLAGLAAGAAAFLGSSYYGSASCGAAQGYELYVIASAVTGGSSLSGGKGSAVNSLLGALLIVLIRQAIRLLHFDTNYEWIIIGAAIIIAVVLDQLSARLAAKRLAQAAGRSKDEG